MDIACPACGGQWRQAKYDLPGAASAFRQLNDSMDFDLWRYQALLPIQNIEMAPRIGEGGTPLLHAENLGMMLGLNNLFIKDERQGPTASFKDRQAAVTVAMLREAGLTEVVVASTGNVAIAYSAFCALAGIKLWAFLTSLVPADKMHEVAIYGSQVVKVTSTYDQAKQLAAQFASDRKLYLDRGTRSIGAVEAMKTIALEIAEQLARHLGPPSERNSEEMIWRSPDWYLQAVSGAIGPYGVRKGFDELKSMGISNKIPALGIIQAEGCSPMVNSWRNQQEEVTPVANPSTHISTLSTGNPGRTYSLMRQQMLSEGGGVMESVTDEDAFRALHTVAKMEGLSIEPAAAVAFAGLFKLVKQGKIASDEIVVVNCSGHTMPIESSLLGEGWSKDVELPQGELPESPNEGLLAALARLDQTRIQHVLVVDDHADARRLIRRILQAHGEYAIDEASNGAEAIEKAVQDTPDLIILDLMMPEMDGFTVLDRLKTYQETADLPVVVVTAKELTGAEKKKLEGQIARLMIKGDFLSEDFLDEIGKVFE
jgi:threonine synthase